MRERQMTGGNVCISLNQLFRPINNDECWQCKTTDFRVTHFNESNNYDDANDSDDYDKDDKVNDNHLNKQTFSRLLAKKNKYWRSFALKPERTKRKSHSFTQGQGERGVGDGT